MKVKQLIPEKFVIFIKQSIYFHDQIIFEKIDSINFKYVLKLEIIFSINNKNHSKIRLLLKQLNMNQSFSFNKLVIDKIKKNDLKQIFQILMILPSNRTIADLNSLTKIVLNIEPIKQIKNLSAIYHCCKSMYLAKFKEKDFIFQKKEDSQSLYIILNGKIGLYKRSNQQYESEQVIFLDEGSCFGRLFNWKIKFLPLALEETLIAILPKRQFNKIGVVVNIQKQLIIKQIKSAGIIPAYLNQDLFRSISHTFVINRVPHGHHLIKSGQTPKVIFLIMKGMVKKVVELQKQGQLSDLRVTSYRNQFDSFSVTHYSAGDFFPKSNLNSPVKYNLVTQCPSQIVTIPKKALKSIGFNFVTDKVQQNKDCQFYKKQLEKQKDWQSFKQSIITDTVATSKMKKNVNFR